MALLTTKTISVVDKLVSFNNTYVKVESVHGTKNQISILVETRTIKDGLIIDTCSFNFIHNCESDSGVFKQAYEYLKTLPEFANATDC